MKKLLVGMGIMCFLLCANSSFASKFEAAPNAGNMDFYPMMQRQMEQEETLDFANHPEQYEKNREKKDNLVKKSKFDPNYTPDYSNGFFKKNNSNKMQFTKEADGSIKIQEVR